MAFEEINTGGVDVVTYLTKKGIKDLLNNKFDVSFFSIDDSCINYEETVTDSVKIKAITGDNLKTFVNGPTELAYIGGAPTTIDDGDSVEVSKREIIFVDDCNGTERKNIDVEINLGNYFESLRNTLTNINSVSNTYEPFVKIFEYVKMNEYVENAFGEYKLWDTKDYNFKYYLNPEDYKKYETITKTFVSKNRTTKVMYDTNRFKSPLMMTFQSKRNPNGLVYQNGPLTIETYPIEEHVYMVDGIVLTPVQLNQGVYDSAKNIMPLVKFNGGQYRLNVDSDTVFKSNVNKAIFRFNGLLEAAIVSMKNLAEFYFSDSVSGEKFTTINMRVNSDSVKGIKAKDANIRITFKINLDESTWTTSNIVTFK